MTLFQFLHAALIGIGLAASCGFRVFVPMLVMSIAVRAGQIELSEGWAWLGSWPALAAFSVASIVELVAYYIPWVDNLLDTIQSPAAVIAGIIATAACVSEMNPLVQWSTAIIAGGGVAAVVQAATVFVRGTSTATTAGLGNWLVSTVELVMSFLMAVMAVVVPILAGLTFIAIGAYVVRRVMKARARKKAMAVKDPTGSEAQTNAL
jgi:hypothetical protein